ncbi:hypothetical protein A8C32_03975 [Flavivirga aquatica]|uniref:Uncharacterized protein n=1 Tax=Flavivirga aquatica TaxID=1849968 RepID=A0A1E5TB97_9FLAO|nr:hypothetical protein [Flavivirga aquatica]OEK08616.1 hypothetical protein A8C32_03975 [Flavivirga aquatica]
MNKTLIYALIFILSACANKKESLSSFEQKNPVVIKLGKKYKKIFRINIPIGLSVKNKSILNKSFITIDYKYTPYSKGIGEDIYISKGKELIEVKNNLKKNITPYTSNEYIIYSRYRLDSLESTQKQFKSYIKRMLAENKDTLHIGTVKEFKIKHKVLFEKLTKNDSISIQFLDDGKLGERITVPVKW